MTDLKPNLLHRFYLLLADRPIVIVTLAATAVLLVLHLKIEQQVSGESLGTLYLQLSFSKIFFESVLASWQTAGINRYLETIWIDFLLAFCAALLLASAAAHFQSLHKSVSEGNKKFILMLAPFAYMLFEFIENSFHLYIIAGHHFSNTLIMTSSIVSFIKLVFFFIGTGWMLRCYRDFRKSKKTAK